ncbi:Dihydrolipoyllysine-residue acetyltransferase component of pyruvate dehydrogenase complex [uncultured Roseburia sp.]|uniref:Dihydrolipoamide acetyltransferase component of pyruvate dehydrogenase complex n=1 Tax=Brotonthovivens ammoniilytica TaxID=2981725 RepID=A0ABT2TFW5_9FIRM|nr:dihydrolipoamide acetyltransferase family protein [Brotonthovivens ammoniilytica]MCU6761070.1 2-oxo acid dehydrogenase subunit E2 [Brotonthovivens ammoniilytica]SCI18013.1 Dihydrolipoyllysine-residue acetyltransferase component of pyruvate dehydrogenase complex [uncultured Roseburia sp.]
MAEVIIMPKLGFNMDEGELVSWHKKAGDPIAKGELFFEINTDKTTMPIEATSDGVVLKILVEEGETVEVFTPVAVVGQEGEDPDAVLAQGVATASLDGRVDESSADGKAEENKKEPQSEAQCQSGVSETDIKDLKLTPKARKLILDESLDPVSIAKITGTGYQGGITAKDIKASPLARKLAEKSGVDLLAVEGTGVNGKIMKEDVKRAAEHQAYTEDTSEKKVLSAVPYKGVRKIIGDKLAESKFTAPHLYFTDAVDTTNMTAFRKEMNQVSERKITVSDLLVYAAGKALVKFPGINTSLVDGNIVTYESTNIGVAVAGDNGLVVPVIKNVQEKSLTKVSEENRDLVDRAKEGHLKPEEYTGGTFSISNLGMFGIDNFTAIINPPEAAILSVSSVRKTPVVVEKDGEDKIEIRPMMNIQLSVDHRLIDGLLAAQFVGYMKELLENPLKILM